MNRTLFTASVAILALTGVSALASQPPEEQAKQKAEADARYEALQAQARQQEEERRQAQLRYEQGVAEAAEARRRYEAENARYQAELARSREAQADYERRMREREAEGGRRGQSSATAPAGTTDRGASSVLPTGVDGRTCEQQQRRNRRRGRTAGGLVGGVAGGLLGNSNLGRLAAIGTLAPVGALIGDAIASRLNCREQIQAAAATEEAVRGGVGTTTTWTSDTRPNVTGSSTVVSADASTPNEAQCLTVTDIIIVDGEETRAPKRMCRRPPSNAFVRV
ncbi:MAG TPA: hypothetical protein VIT38_04170 [Allosphingosinicella sp.]